MIRVKVNYKEGVKVRLTQERKVKLNKHKLKKEDDIQICMKCNKPKCNKGTCENFKR